MLALTSSVALWKSKWGKNDFDFNVWFWMISSSLFEMPWHVFFKRGWEISWKIFNSQEKNEKKKFRIFSEILFALIDRFPKKSSASDFIKLKVEWRISSETESFHLPNPNAIPLGFIFDSKTLLSNLSWECKKSSPKSFLFKT